MRLNGFLDLAESRSTHTTGRVASCDAAYTFEFLTLQQNQKPAEACQSLRPGDAQPRDEAAAMHPLVSTVNVPDALMPAATSPSLKSQWAVLSAQCAVDLLTKASMDVPEELLKASLSASRFQKSAPDPARKGNSYSAVDIDGSRRQGQHHEKVRSRAASALSRDEVIKMTLKNIREHEDFEMVEQDGRGGFRPAFEANVPGNQSRKHSRARPQGVGSGTKGHDHPFMRRKDKEALVWQIFNSKRVSVSPGMENRPEDVMRGAAELQAFLLARADDLELHDPRWTSMILMLTPSEEVDGANAACAAENGPQHVVHVPCPLVPSGKSVLHDGQRLVEELRRAVLRQEEV